MSRFIVEPALNAAKRVLSQTALDISAATSGRRYPYRLISSEKPTRIAASCFLSVKGVARTTPPLA